MDAIILAAGRGERLRPRTDRVPKALMPIHGIPLIVRIVERLRAYRVERIVVNISWLGEMIREAVGDGRRWGCEIVYSEESQPLETGGGIRLALVQKLLRSDPFLVHNADVLSDVPLDALQLTSREEGQLVLVMNPPQHQEGDFSWIDGKVGLHGSTRLTYAGIGLYRPLLFSPLEIGRCRLRPLLERAIQRERLSAYIHRGRWWDVGTPEVLSDLESHPEWLEGI